MGTTTTPLNAEPQDLIGPAILEHTVRRAEDLGLDDGRVGAPPTGARTQITALAEEAWLLGVSQLQQGLAQANETTAAEEHTQRDAALGLERVQQDLLAKDKDRNQRPGKYNLRIGTILIVAACLLFVSDIPLSLSLVGKGLHLPGQARYLTSATNNSMWANDPYVREELGIRSPEEEDKWRKDALRGNTLGATDLFRKFATVLRLFWDTYALAIGIALLGFAIKPLLDLIFENDEQHQRAARALLWTAMGLFLLTTVTLGVFRGNMLKEDLVSSLQAEERRLQAETTAARGDPNSADTVKIIEQQRQVVAERINKEEARWLPTMAFILLTTALPLIGAVCFYFGAQRRDHANALKRLRQECSTATDRVRDAAGRVALAQSRREQLRSLLAELNTQPFKTTFVQRCQTAYERSFMHGVRDAERDLEPLSLYDRLRYAYHRSLARYQRSLRFGEPNL
jgi:hypothetical protein